jgi:hypothetical protein
VKVAGAPPNVTSVAPVKALPVIVTPVPDRPPVGDRSVIAGVTLKNLFLLVTFPAGVCTLIVAREAPIGTVVVIEVSLLTVKLSVFTTPKRTVVAPVKPLPVMVTAVPTGPAVGEKLEMAGPVAYAAVADVTTGVPSSTRTDANASTHAGLVRWRHMDLEVP